MILHVADEWVTFLSVFDDEFTNGFEREMGVEKLIDG